GGFRVAEHDANLHTDLVNEDDHAVSAFDGSRQFTQGLAHQTGLQTRQGIAHIAFDFSLGSQGGHRVDNNQVYRTRTHQGFGNFQSLLAGIRLGDQQIAQVHAQFLSVLHVQRVFGVNKGTCAFELLHLCNHLQGQRGFTRRFRAVNFNNATTWQTTDAQSNVQTQGTRGDHLDVMLDVVVAITHDRALAELLFDLRQSGGQRFGTFRGHCFAVFIVHEKSLTVEWRPNGRARQLKIKPNYCIKLYCIYTQIFKYIS